MTDDEALTREMSYTRWDESCQDPYNPHYWCRRPHGHTGPHAAGFGSERLHWPRDDDS